MSEIIHEEVQNGENKYRFEKVHDKRGRRVEHLWLRNGRYYAQVFVAGKGCRRAPLFKPNNVAVETLAEAKVARDEMLTLLRKGEPPTARRSLEFPDLVQRYTTWCKATHAKHQKTIKKETAHLNAWKRSLGNVRLNAITPKTVNDHVLRRKQEDKVSNRTVNLDVLILNNALDFAQKEKHMGDKLPTQGWKDLEAKPPVRPLRTPEQVDALINEALRVDADGKPVYFNGELVADYARLMAYSGARCSSALALRWSDVDFEKKQVNFHREMKYGKVAVVDFNPQLEALLGEMHGRRVPDSDFVFPAPRGEHDERGAINIRESWNTIRDAAGLPTDFTYHDLRHYFISHCVMSGVDFMSIAKWVGHADGGILIGKVYGHLSNEHLRKAAAKVRLDMPAPEPAAPASPQTATQTEVAALATLTKMSVPELLALVHKAQAAQTNKP